MDYPVQNQQTQSYSPAGNDRTTSSMPSHEQQLSIGIGESWLESSHVIYSIALGIVICGVLLAIVKIVGEFYQRHGKLFYLEEIIFKRGPIQFFELATFSFGCAMVLIRTVFCYLEKSLVTKAGRALAYNQTEEGVFQNSILGKPSLVSVLYRAIKNSVFRADKVDFIIDLQESEMISTHNPIRYAIWLLPSLGFMGTVLGISLAVSEFARAIVSEGDINIQKYLGPVCSNLSIAFDTTFLALILSSILMLMFYHMERQEQNLITQVRRIGSLLAGKYVRAGEVQLGHREVVLGSDFRVLAENTVSDFEKILAEAIQKSLTQILTEAKQTAEDLGSISAIVELHQGIRGLAEAIKNSTMELVSSIETLSSIKEIAVEELSLLSQLNNGVTQAQKEIKRGVEIAEARFDQALDQLKAVASVMNALSSGMIEPVLQLKLKQRDQ